jgi:hypothetical protein
VTTAGAWIGLGIFLIAAIAVVFGAVSVYTDEAYMRDHGVVVPARVVELTPGKTSEHVFVTFTTQDGQTMSHVEPSSYSWTPYPLVGDILSIRYNPRHPDVMAQDTRASHNAWIAPIILGILALALVSIGVLFWAFVRRKSARSR